MELINLSFFNISGWGIDLDYCDVEWFALKTNRDHFFVFADSIELLRLRLQTI